MVFSPLKYIKKSITLYGPIIIGGIKIMSNILNTMFNPI